MKAALIRQTGAPSVIEIGELPIPDPRPTEVLVKVGAVSVNPIDTYIRSGAVSMISQFPYVIGSDLAGTVEKVGSEVKRFKVGDRVWGSNQGCLAVEGHSRNMPRWMNAGSIRRLRKKPTAKLRPVRWLD